MPDSGVNPDIHRGHAGKGSAKLTIQAVRTKKKSKHICAHEEKPWFKALLSLALQPF